MQRLRWHSERPVWIACFYFLLRNFHFEYLMMRAEENSGHHHHITSLSGIVVFSFRRRRSLASKYIRFNPEHLSIWFFVFVSMFIPKSGTTRTGSDSAALRWKTNNYLFDMPSPYRRTKGNKYNANANVPERKWLTFEISLNFYFLGFTPLCIVHTTVCHTRCVENARYYFFFLSKKMKMSPGYRPPDSARSDDFKSVESRSKAKMHTPVSQHESHG